MSSASFDLSRPERVEGKTRWTLRRIWRDNGLSITIVLLFILCWIGQTLFGLHSYNQDRVTHHQSRVSILQYLHSGHFIEATAENWESEFLQMAMFVILTACLYQKGSPESKDPDEPDEAVPVTKDSPWPVHKGGWALKLYENSLAFTFLLLFLISFVLHAVGGWWLYNEEEARVGHAGVSLVGFLGTSEFWFQSFENWQSEFLSIAAMVVLSIFLRQKGSAESKAVPVPHWKNE